MGTNMRRCRRTIATLTTALALLACQQLAGIEQLPGASIDGGVVDTGPTCVALPTDGTGCSSCLKTSCCAEIDACDRDVACASGRRCLSACTPGDEPCRAACNVPLGPALDPLLACEAQQCAGACGLVCGGMVGIDVAAILGSAVLPDCAPCIERLSCDLYAKCASNLLCVDFVACAKACNPLDRSCIDQCTSDPEVNAYFTSVSALLLQCSPECGIGHEYRCLGHVAWPQPRSVGTIELTVPVVEFNEALSPVAGALVRVCDEGSIDDCLEVGPRPHVLTDADGLARVLVPVTTSVFGGFGGRIEVSMDGYVTILRLAGPPPAGSQRLAATPLIPNAFAAVLPSQVGADTSGGVVVTLVHDCNWAAAPDATLAISSPGAVPFYFVTLKTISGKGPTTTTGLGGFFQVSPGSQTSSATVSIKGADQTLGRRLVPVRAGAYTFVDLVPSP